VFTTITDFITQQTGATSSLVSDVLQYGVLGIVAVALAAAVNVLFKRETDTLERERTRADALQKELTEVNHQIQERYLLTQQATSAVREALEIVSEIKKEDHQ
jgi:hypothetical protein